MIAQPLPSAVYLDSSVFVAANDGGDPHSTACAQYCADLAANDSTVYFSELARLEIAHVIRRLAATNAAPQHLHRQYRLNRFNTNRMVRQQWMQFGMGEFDALLRTFSIVYEAPYRGAIWRQSIQLMASHNLRSYDAAHIATAIALGIADFASVDSDYLRVSGLRMHLIR